MEACGKPHKNGDLAVSIDRIDLGSTLIIFAAVGIIASHKVGRATNMALGIMRQWARNLHFMITFFADQGLAGEIAYIFILRGINHFRFEQLH